jgi:ribose transport system substrate-binding protein
VTTSTDTPRDTDRTASDARANAGAAVDTRPRRTFSPLSLVLFLALVGVLLYYSGLFRGDPRVAVVTSGDGPYWDSVLSGAADAARRHDVKLTVIRSKSDTKEQTQHIQSLLRQRPDGIAISPLDPDLQSTVLAAVAADTTLVTFDSDSPVARRLCFVGTDNYAAGRLVGEAVKRAVPDGGEVVICMGFPNKDNTLRRRQGVIDELLDRPDDPQHRWDALDQPLKGERFTIAATLADEGDRDRAKVLADESIKTRPNVKCYVGLVSYSAPTVAQALKDAGKSGQAKVVSFDVDERTLNGIGDGSIEATVMQDQYGLGYHAVRILAAEANNNRGELPAFQMHVLPCWLVTKDNLEQARAKLKNPGPSADVSPPPPSQRPVPAGPDDQPDQPEQPAASQPVARN